MIEIQDLTQIYPSKKGIFDITFTVREGEVFGYLGPNGAGKTTTIRNILGFMNPSKGSVRINDLDPRHDQVKVNQMIGYLPGEIEFFENYTGIQYLDFLKEMRKLIDLSYRDDLIQRFDFNPNQKIKKMSKGMKQKLSIISAFMHDPSILILDEPTSGLDPLMQNKFLDLVLEEKDKGKTILMSSHIFEEVERVCDRAGIIKDGKILTIENFKEEQKKVADVFIVTLDQEDDSLLHTSLKIEKQDTCKYQIDVHNNYNELFTTLSKYNVTSLESKKLTIETIFMKYYEDGETS